RRRLMKEQTEKAVKALQDVGLEFATSRDIKLTDPSAAQLKEIERRSETELRRIAESLGMKFSKTDLVSKSELSEIPGLGKAIEPMSLETLRNEPTSIVDLAFASEALCRVFQAENPLDNTNYICWKVQDVAAHVP